MREKNQTTLLPLLVRIPYPAVQTSTLLRPMWSCNSRLPRAQRIHLLEFHLPNLVHRRLKEALDAAPQPEQSSIARTSTPASLYELPSQCIETLFPDSPLVRFYPRYQVD